MRRPRFGCFNLRRISNDAWNSSPFQLGTSALHATQSSSGSARARSLGGFVGLLGQQRSLICPFSVHPAERCAVHDELVMRTRDGKCLDCENYCEHQYENKQFHHFSLLYTPICRVQPACRASQYAALSLHSAFNCSPYGSVHDIHYQTVIDGTCNRQML